MLKRTITIMREKLDEARKNKKSKGLQWKVIKKIVYSICLAVIALDLEFTLPSPILGL
jgi:hypothetical protein